MIIPKIPLYRGDPEGSCIFVFSVSENQVFLHVRKRVDLEQYMSGNKKPAKKTPLPEPISEVQVGTQLQLSLHHPDGTNAYSTASSWLVLKASPEIPFKTVERMNGAIEALGEIADDLVKRRVKDQAEVVKLKPAGLHKPDHKLVDDDLMNMTEMEELDEDEDEDFDDELV